MSQDQRNWRRSSRDWDDERESGRDDNWRGQSHGNRYRGHGDDDYSSNYRGSTYAGSRDEHDYRQDRDYRGTLRAGNYGRYEEEDAGSYPPRFRSEGRSGRDYRESDFGAGSEGYGGYESGGYGRRGAGSGGDRYGQYGGGYSSRPPGGSSGGGYRSRDRDYRGAEYGSRRSSGGGYGTRDYGSEYGGYGFGYDGGFGYGGGMSGGGGFGSYTADYDRKYGSGGWAGRGYSDRGYGERGYGNRDRGWWDKATDEVSSWFGDDEAERRRRMDLHRGRGPKNYSRSDDRIREDVSDRLTDDPLVDASEIEVRVDNREVTLTGTVSSRNEKRLAEECADAVSGVTHVQNNLRVKDRQSQYAGGSSASGGISAGSMSGTSAGFSGGSGTSGNGSGGVSGTSGTFGSGPGNSTTAK